MITLPTLKIEGTTFYVDVEMDVLFEKMNAQNKISFDDMTFFEGEYHFLFDCFSKNMATEESFAENIFPVHIPQRAALDPAGMMTRYYADHINLTGKTDEDMVPQLKQRRERLKGASPRVMLVGNIFLVDIEKHQLQGVLPPREIIDLRQEEMSPDGRRYRFFFDPMAGRQIRFDHTSTEVPEYAILMEVPTEKVMDPVGFYRQLGMKDEMIVKTVPIGPAFQPKIIPIGKTQVPELIRKNRERMEAKVQQETGQSFRWPKLFKKRRGRR